MRGRISKGSFAGLLSVIIVCLVWLGNPGAAAEEVPAKAKINTTVAPAEETKRAEAAKPTDSKPKNPPASKAKSEAPAAGQEDTTKAETTQQAKPPSQPMPKTSSPAQVPTAQPAETIVVQPVSEVQAKLEQPAAIVLPSVALSQAVNNNGGYCLTYVGQGTDRYFVIGISYPSGAVYNGGNAVEPGKTVELCAPVLLDPVPAGCNGFMLELWFEDEHGTSYDIDNLTLKRPGCEPTEPTCVKDTDSKKVGSYTREGLTWTVVITGKLPLCTPVHAIAVTWQYEAPPALWPQLNPQPGSSVVIEKPGTYKVTAPESCGQHDTYADRGKAPTWPERLKGSHDPFEPPFISDFFKGPAASVADDPKKCAPAKKPAVAAEAAGCVSTNDGEVTVRVRNPNTRAVTYTVKLNSQASPPLTLKAGESDTVEFSGLAAAQYDPVVRGSDGTEVAVSVTLQACPASPTSPVTQPMTPTQPAFAPIAHQQSSLASTGASLAWPLTLGGAALLIGGGLVAFARRRQNN